MRSSLVLFLLIFHAMSVWAGSTVFTSIGPVSFLVERIGGALVEVGTLIPMGKNPHDYAPTPQDIKKLNTAALYFTVDAPFEKAMVERVQGMKNLKLVNLGKELAKKIIIEHGHEELDPHVWLSPANLKKMSIQISGALTELNPESKSLFQANSDLLLKEIEKVDQEIRKNLASLKGKAILVFHPAFGHFLEEYGMHQESIEIEGKEPTPRHITDLILKAKKQNVKVLFIQPQFSQKAALTIAKGIGGKVESINPLEKDLLNNLLKMSQAIGQAYHE